MSYYTENREKILEYKRKYRNKNKEKLYKYYINNREKINKNSIERYHKNKSRILNKIKLKKQYLIQSFNMLSKYGTSEDLEFCRKIAYLIPRSN